MRRADVVPLECVARGYLSGSGWAQYRETGSVCGVGLPAGLVESDRLPEPIFTPTTKAAEGHDLPVTPDRGGRHRRPRVCSSACRELTIGIYERIAATAAERGVIVADTKFEFGFAGGELMLVDEVGTPDSSRFWPADDYRPGQAQPSFDKQYVRDWLDASRMGSRAAAALPPRRRRRRHGGPLPRGLRASDRPAVRRVPAVRWASTTLPTADAAALDRLREEHA